KRSGRCSPPRGRPSIPRSAGFEIEGVHQVGDRVRAYFLEHRVDQTAGVAPGQYRPRCGLLNRKGIVQHHRFHRLLLPAGDRRPNQAGKYQNPFHIDQ
ncbi:MAG: hypothetical protein II062_07870, partial [Oscillospiraceae bacterium]|nr:hypothetical protein [Oscillospiraceae bacterium]